jgi:hypothetical protein
MIISIMAMMTKVIIASPVHETGVHETHNRSTAAMGLIGKTALNVGKLIIIPKRVKHWLVHRKPPWQQQVCGRLWLVIKLL